MIIVICSFKGGEGKTRIAVNLALTLDFAYITNDVYNRKIEEAFTENKILKVFPNDEMPDLDPKDNIIVDLGGYADSRTPKILKKAKYIIVPITYNENDFDTAYGTLEEIREYNKNIVIVANRTEKGEFNLIKNELEKEGYKYPIFEIKKSKAVAKVLQRKEPIKKTAEDKLLKFHYQKKWRMIFPSCQLNVDGTPLFAGENPKRVITLQMTGLLKVQVDIL